jgi:multidrug efflux system outer membrane protein
MPVMTMRYNEYRSAQINGSAAPGFSSDQATAALEDVFKQTMPHEMGFDYKWWEVFRDEELQNLIKTALQQSYDLRDAVTRVEMAQAVLGITRSDQFPQASASGNVNFTRPSRNGALPLPPDLVLSQNRNWGQAQLNLLSFEVDLWGRLRRATEAARASLLSAEENRKAVVTTLVSDVAAQYFTLRELDAQLEISRQTLATRQEALRLTTRAAITVSQRIWI